MSETRYTKDHEYVRRDGDAFLVGVTDYAQAALGDVVFVELPTVGAAFKAGEQAAVVESVKAASEVFAPIAGEIVAVNAALEGAPETVNADSAGAGWFFRLRASDPADLDALMDEAAYQSYVASLG